MSISCIHSTKSRVLTETVETKTNPRRKFHFMASFHYFKADVCLSSWIVKFPEELLKGLWKYLSAQENVQRKNYWLCETARKLVASCNSKILCIAWLLLYLLRNSKWQLVYLFFILCLELQIVTLTLSFTLFFIGISANRFVSWLNLFLFCRYAFPLSRPNKELTKVLVQVSHNVKLSSDPSRSAARCVSADISWPISW